MKWVGQALMAAFFVVGVGANCFGAIVWTRGHGDIGVEFKNSSLGLHFHLEDLSPGNFLGGIPSSAEAEPGDLIVGVPSARQTTRASGTAWNFTGATASAPFWILPNGDEGNHPFVGFAAETGEIGLGWTNFRFSVAAMSGPGQFSMWTGGSGGGDPVVRVSADRSINEFSINAGAHNHLNMGFTAEGMYAVTLQVLGTRTDNSTFSASDTFSFAVGDNAINIASVPEPSSILLLGITGISGFGLAWLRRKRLNVSKP